jgi:hypothetical protein
LLEFTDFFMKHLVEFLLLLEIDVIALVRVNNLLQLVILVLALFLQLAVDFLLLGHEFKQFFMLVGELKQFAFESLVISLKFMERINNTIVLFEEGVVLVLDGVELDEFHSVLVGRFSVSGVLVFELFDLVGEEGVVALVFLELLLQFVVGLLEDNELLLVLILKILNIVTILAAELLEALHEFVLVFFGQFAL